MNCALSLIFYLVFGLTHCQEVDDVSARIQEGKKYLTAERLNEWERCLREGADQLGRIELTLNGKLFAETLIKDGHWITNEGLGTENKINFLDISNPKYFARLSTVNDKTVLEYFYKYRDPAEAAKPHRQILARSEFAGNPIPEQLRLGKIEIADYRQDGDFHYVKFIPSPSVVNEDDPVNGLDFVEVRFDSRYPPLPDSWAYQEKGKAPRTAVSRAFEKIGDYWWSTSGGMYEGLKFDFGDKLDPKVFSSYITQKYFPNESLDPQHCYLAHYGIAEPGMPPIADFGREGNRWFWPTIIVLAMIGVGAIFYWYRSRK